MHLRNIYIVSGICFNTIQTCEIYFHIFKAVLFPFLVKQIQFAKFEYVVPQLISVLGQLMFIINKNCDVQAALKMCDLNQLYAQPNYSGNGGKFKKNLKIQKRLCLSLLYPSFLWGLFCFIFSFLFTVLQITVGPMLSIFFWELHRLSIFDLGILITPIQ